MGTQHGVRKTDEPTVIGWAPGAQIYFRDPDGHMLEFITILADPPNPSFNGRYSEWKKLTTRPNASQR
jgi:lactoylglutathione lyase